ncbi:MAG: calcineurin-like phosphoesterase C-terminal domain-containing protein [Bacteroidales bacterium]|nr:calcineurin-like phosphoesterase C-terminal domain-containing protein [Bacteroidales bacterium]
MAAVTLALTCTLAGGVRLSGAERQGRVLRVALVGDPQVDNPVEMGYARRSIYRDLRGRRDLDLCIFLGDLVNDNMSLLPESLSVIDSLPFQSFMVPGNHDRDVYRGAKSSGSMSRPRDLSTWRKLVGYVDTSFVRGNVRFIMMNNVRHAAAGMTDYVGGFTEKQKHWLDSVLVTDVARGGKMSSGSVDRSRRPSRGKVTPALTILATHIPFSQMKGRDSVLALIPEHTRILYVSGHTHFVSRDDSIPEVIAGATCGSWWRGVKDSDGVPYALQSCGAPRGYFVAEIRRDGDYRLRYRCVGMDDEVSVWGVRVEGEGAVRTEDNIVMGKDESEGVTVKEGGFVRAKKDSGVYRLYINVFGGAPDGVVRVRGGRRWRIVSRGNGVCVDNGSDSPDVFMESPRRKRYLVCERSTKTAPEVEQVIEFNASMSRDYRKSHRDEFIPLRRKPSTHIWQTTDFVSGPLPVYVNVVYRDSHMRFRQRVPVTVIRSH